MAKKCRTDALHTHAQHVFLCSPLATVLRTPRVHSWLCAFYSFLLNAGVVRPTRERCLFQGGCCCTHADLSRARIGAILAAPPVSSSLVFVLSWQIQAWEAHTDYIRYLEVHPTLPYVLSASDDMSVKLWDWDRQWDCTQVRRGKKIEHNQC